MLVEVRSSKDCNDVWFACGIYGWADRANKYKTWDLMRKIRDEVRGPMVVFGDFNEILNSEEKEGGGARQDRDMQAFHDCLDDCGFRDLGFKGSTFTWIRGNGPSTMIKERLDRFFACSEWQTMFQSMMSAISLFIGRTMLLSCYTPRNHNMRDVTKNCFALSLFGFLMINAGML